MAQATLAPSQLGDRAGFLAAARDQGKCQVTGATGWGWHPHHVIYEQHLIRAGLPVYDPRNVLRVSENAHANHHHRVRCIRTLELRRENIDYAVEKLGAGRALDYLRRYYDDTTDPDPRLVAIEARL